MPDDLDHVHGYLDAADRNAFDNPERAIAYALVAIGECLVTLVDKSEPTAGVEGGGG